MQALPQLEMVAIHIRKLGVLGALLALLCATTHAVTAEEPGALPSGSIQIEKFRLFRCIFSVSLRDNSELPLSRWVRMMLGNAWGPGGRLSVV